MKYIPAGSMRKQRWIGRAQGFACAVVFMSAIGAAVVLATPIEIVKTKYPSKVVPSSNEKYSYPVVEIPPCNDMTAKDCMSIPDNDVAIVRTVAEPSPLWLLLSVGLIPFFKRKERENKNVQSN